MNHMSGIKILIVSFVQEHSLAIGVCSYLVPKIKGGQGVWDFCQTKPKHPLE